MFVVRLIGLLFIITALMALGSDALLSLEAREVTMRSFNDLWGMLPLGDPEEPVSTRRQSCRSLVGLM